MKIEYAILNVLNNIISAHCIVRSNILTDTYVQMKISIYVHVHVYIHIRVS